MRPSAAPGTITVTGYFLLYCYVINLTVINHTETIFFNSPNRFEIYSVYFLMRIGDVSDCLYHPGSVISGARMTRI